jgi:hypothetical protein
VSVVDTLSVTGIGPLIRTRFYYDSLAVVAAEYRRARRPDVVRLLHEARRVEVFRVSSVPSDHGSSKHAIQDYPILSSARDPGAAFRDSLIALVERESTFDTGERLGEKTCLFSPGFGVRAAHDTDTLEVLVCFNCRQWALYGPGAKGLGGDFDREVVAMKALFDDAFARGEHPPKPH